jgi:hypothetical protein
LIPFFFLFKEQHYLFYTMMQPQNALPHLPHGMTIPQVQISATTEPIMPGQNMLEYGESTMDNQSYQMTQRRSSQDQQMVLMKPPPMFTAQPKLMTSFRSPNARAQRDVHRQESGIDPVGVMSSRLESWRLAVKDLVSFIDKTCSYFLLTVVIRSPFSKKSLKPKKTVQKVGLAPVVRSTHPSATRTANS